jgi:hypothetical protein
LGVEAFEFTLEGSGRRPEKRQPLLLLHGLWGFAGEARQQLRPNPDPHRTSSRRTSPHHDTPRELFFLKGHNTLR